MSRASRGRRIAVVAGCGVAVVAEGNERAASHAQRLLDELDARLANAASP